MLQPPVAGFPATTHPATTNPASSSTFVVESGNVLAGNGIEKKPRQNQNWSNLKGLPGRAPRANNQPCPLADFPARSQANCVSELRSRTLIVPRKRRQDGWGHQLFHTIVPRRPDPMQPDPCPRRRAAMPPTAHSAMKPLPGTTSCFVVTKAMPTGASLLSTLATTQSTLAFEAPATAAVTAGIMLASEDAGT